MLDPNTTSKESPLPKDCEDEIQSMLEAARVPGAAISLITPEGTSELMFGKRDIGSGAPVLRTTGFQLCSVSKAYVGTLGAALQHAGILSLDDPFCRTVPEYAPEPAWLREEIRFRDLLSNRLGVDKGGLSDFGLSDRYDYADLARRMSHVPLVAPFRGRYTYSNQAFCIAVLGFERLTGRTFEQLLDEYVLGPAGMTHTTMGPEARASQDRATAYTINRRNEFETVDVEDDWARPGGGGILSTAADQQTWLRLNLGRGQLDGKQVLPASMWDDIWYPYISLNRDARKLMSKSHRHLMLGDADVPFTAYGLGWWLTTYHGRYMVAHSGGGAGWRTYSSMLPDQGIGVSVLINVDGKVGTAVVHRLLERALRLPARPWFDIVRDDRAQRLEAARVAVESAFPSSPDAPLAVDQIAGRYGNPESGPVEVVATSAGLEIRFLDGPTYNGLLQPLGGANYVHNVVGPFATYDGPTAPSHRTRFKMKDGAVVRLLHSYLGSFERCDGSALGSGSSDGMAA